MNAQQIINDANLDSDKNMKIFYPELYAEKQASRNITKILQVRL